MKRSSRVRAIGNEFASASLGNKRRTERLVRIVTSLDRAPALGFPKALGSEAELEGFYRFINNDGFSAADILAPHQEATLRRAQAASEVIVVHDTTTVEYGGASLRRGLGVTTAGRRGFMAHASLVLSSEGVPLGVGHLETITRTGKKRRERKTTSKVMRADKQRESLRWLRGVEAVEAQRQGRFEAIHVTDAEGDFFELLAFMHSQQARFVIRAGQLDRIVTDDKDSLRKLREVIDEIPVRPTLKRTIELGARKYRPKSRARSARRRHPERDARKAYVAIGAATVHIEKTRYSDVLLPAFAIHIVRVWEPAPPEGVHAVEWVLFTQEPICSKKDLERVIDIYRQRWTIEDYFKALKTGCSLEKRQVESYEALTKVLALLAPIAYRLLLLRGIERQSPAAPAQTLFTAMELRMLANAPSNLSLPTPRTVADALAHVARLGGHLRNNGPPGWITLGRGYETLLTLCLGARMGRKWCAKSDQS